MLAMNYVNVVPTCFTFDKVYIVDYNPSNEVETRLNKG